MSDEQHSYWPHSPEYNLAPLGRRITVPNPLYEGVPLSVMGDWAGTPAYGPAWFPPNPGASQVSWRGTDAAQPVVGRYDNVRQWLVDLGMVYGAPQNLIDLTNALDWNSDDTLISAAQNMQGLLDDCGVQWSTPETPWAGFTGMLETDAWGPQLSEIVRARIAYYCPDFTMRPFTPIEPPPMAVYQATAPAPVVTPSQVVDQAPPQMLVAPQPTPTAAPPVVNGKRYPWGYVLGGAGLLAVLGGAIYFSTRRKKKRRNPRRRRAARATSSGPPRANPRRESGAATVNIRYRDATDDYAGSVSAPGVRPYKFDGLRAPAAGLRGGVAVDSPAAYDQMAQAALGFASYDRDDIGDALDYSDTGVEVRRPKRKRKGKRNPTVTRDGAFAPEYVQGFGPWGDLLPVMTVEQRTRAAHVLTSRGHRHAQGFHVDESGAFDVEPRGREVRKPSKRKNLSKSYRRSLPDRDFAIPKRRKYPMQTMAQAEKALTYAEWPNNAKDRAQVRRAVFKKYPALRRSNPCSTYGEGRPPPRRVQVAKKRGVKLQGSKLVVPRAKKKKKKTKKKTGPKRRRAR